ncbi:hypothetical protein QYE76_046249 [Lolium multiflorum]|uniref:Transposase (putative) gypsy type domain-containing protein n=1 Tax=Lolium multiflorum TaxID=4521 RepID=A0AAD8TN09_LOLMU|nr:hypothetical protein QYE76_046249 [Lolium multiflorum]
MHHLTPNSILHISIFITLCECFLGVAPNWALWKRIFCIRRNGSHNITYNIGGVVICVRTDVDYFDVKFPDSVQGWRKRWLYIHEESANSVEHNIIPFDGNAKIQRRRSWDAEASEEEKGDRGTHVSYSSATLEARSYLVFKSLPTSLILECSLFGLAKIPFDSGVNDANRISGDLSTKDFEKLLRRLSRLGKDPIPSSSRVEPYSSTNPLPKPMIKDLLRIGAQFVGYREYANKTEEKLVEANERANILAQQLEHSKEALKKAELDAIEARAEADKAKADAAGVEDLKKKLHTAETSLSDHIAAQSAREEALLKRIRTQSRRFVMRTAQDFELEDPANDPLLDAFSFLEFHGSEAREGIDQAKAGLSRLFPYFFPKKEEPATFLNLAKCFNPSEDLGLRVRHENMKVVAKVHEKVRRRRVGVDRINTKVSPIAEEMIEDLLRMDADFFADGHYADFLGAAPEEDRITLDSILNHD